MPDPLDLPPELLFEVLDALAADDTRHQSRLMLVNRQWRAVMQPRVYSKWTYDGAKQSSASLWSFLLTVLRNPSLAAMVRTLHIGNWGHNPSVVMNRQFDPPPLADSWEDVCRALYRAGLSSMEADIHNDLLRGDRRPLMALLLTALPNIVTLDAHLPPSDPVLGTILEKILEQQTQNAPFAMLPKLTQVRLRGEILPESESGDAPLQLANLWPFILFPSIQSLFIQGIDLEGASSLLTNKENPSLQQLTLVGSKVSNGGVRDMQTILAVPRALESFSLSLGDWKGVIDQPILRLSNPDLWNVLQKHQQSLEVLDIHRYSIRDNKPERRLGCLGSLRSFSVLRDFYIQPEVLLGGCSKSPDSSILLQDTLPYSLKSLTFYGSEGLQYIDNLSIQIR